MRKSQNERKLIDGELTKEAEQLNKYLSQYKYCIARKTALENRKSEIIKLFDYPISSVNLDGMPRGSSSVLGCAEISLKLDEINSIIKKQMETASKTLYDTIKIISLLPENSMERIIVENRYIDLYNWNRICHQNHISRSPAIRRWKCGIYMLLEIEEVKQILNASELVRISS